MRKQTSLLLIILLGSFFLFMFVAGTHGGSLGPLLAQIGVAVGVAPNPYNTLASQLDQEKAQLDQQATDLAAQEAAFASSTAPDAAPATDDWYVDGAITAVAFMLIVNFYLDWRRARRANRTETPSTG